MGRNSSLCLDVPENLICLYSYRSKQTGYQSVCLSIGKLENSLIRADHEGAPYPSRKRYMSAEQNSYAAVSRTLRSHNIAVPPEYSTYEIPGVENRSIWDNTAKGISSMRDHIRGVVNQLQNRAKQSLFGTHAKDLEAIIERANTPGENLHRRIKEWGYYPDYVAQKANVFPLVKITIEGAMSPGKTGPHGKPLLEPKNVYIWYYNPLTEEKYADPNSKVPATFPVWIPLYNIDEKKGKLLYFFDRYKKYLDFETGRNPQSESDWKSWMKHKALRYLKQFDDTLKRLSDVDRELITQLEKHVEALVRIECIPGRSDSGSITINPMFLNFILSVFDNEDKMTKIIGPLMDFPEHGPLHLDDVKKDPSAGWWQTVQKSTLNQLGPRLVSSGMNSVFPQVGFWSPIVDQDKKLISAGMLSMVSLIDSYESYLKSANPDVARGLRDCYLSKVSLSGTKSGSCGTSVSACKLCQIPSSKLPSMQCIHFWRGDDMTQVMEAEVRTGVNSQLFFFIDTEESGRRFKMIHYKRGTRYTAQSNGYLCNPTDLGYGQRPPHMLQEVSQFGLDTVRPVIAAPTALLRPNHGAPSGGAQAHTTTPHQHGHGAPPGNSPAARLHLAASGGPPQTAPFPESSAPPLSQIHTDPTARLHLAASGGPPQTAPFPEPSAPPLSQIHTDPTARLYLAARQTPSTNTQSVIRG